MRKFRLVALGALTFGLVASAWYVRHRWGDGQIAARVKEAVPAIPNLANWPPAYAARVRAATAAANRLEQPQTALAELACLYHANGFYREAEQIERGLNALEPRNAQWTYYLADACRNLGDMEGTQLSLEKTLQLAPYYAPIHLKLANLWFNQGQIDEATMHYEWRLTLVPKDPYARLGLARLALQRDDRHGALRYLEAIARDTPDFPAAHNLLSEIYAGMGDAARAEEQRKLSGSTGELREADDPWLTRLYAFSFDAYRLEVLGANRLQVRQLEASLAFYRQAVHLAPADGLAADALANIYLQLDRPDDARAAIAAGLAAAPRTTALYVTLAQMLRKQRQFPEAVAALQRGTRALPRQAELRRELGSVMEDAGRREEAAAAYREAVRLDPNMAAAHYSLGLCLLALGQEPEAQAGFRRALALRPATSNALIAVAQSEFDAGRLDRTAACLQVLEEFAPDQPDTESLRARWLLRRGDDAARAGRPAEAAQAYRAGLDLARKADDKALVATLDQNLARLQQ